MHHTPLISHCYPPYRFQSILLVTVSTLQMHWWTYIFIHVCWCIKPVLLNSFTNQRPVHVPWDAVQYADQLSIKNTGRNDQKKALIMKAYPLANVPSSALDRLAIIVDKHRIILAWYLPEVLSTSQQVRPSEHIDK